MDLDGEKDGAFVPSKWGNNHGILEIDESLMSQSAELRTTAAHEFFHLIQALYDTRWGFTKGVSKPDHYWLKVAASVWSEEFFSDNTDYVSKTRGGNEKEPFYGWLHQVDQEPDVHGYGMSALLKYISKTYGIIKIKDIFQKIYEGKSVKDAINEALPNNLSSFYGDFINQYLQKQIYNDMGPDRFLIDNNGAV
ncbi:MAG: hypothetical protein CVT92_12750 [Bacteroidetes bacterium HGW-Bacteroidetes-1]|jgi:hypothetical protein|nr:MAG: hypothetical protein CVT92_12750 [Bacteroidetes bacterium HGW-Bacteroidetes-1]